MTPASFYNEAAEAANLPILTHHVVAGIRRSRYIVRKILKFHKFYP